MSIGLVPEPLALLQQAGDEAVLPAGIRLADESRSGRRCYVLLDGAATVEAAGTLVTELGPGAFVGRTDEGGRPLPPSGLTIRLAARSRVLVVDAARLAALIEADPAAAAAWRNLSRQS
jgi:CRP-like cAMP-binding protein